MNPVTEKPEFIFDTRGDWLATRVGVYIFDGRGEWVGFVENRSVFTRDGEWVGDLNKDGRILRKRAAQKPPLNKNIPVKPMLTKRDLPGRAPLPPQMSELRYDTIDVLDEDPDVFKRLSDRRQDMGEG
jgi:hypothetical protein